MILYTPMQLELVFDGLENMKPPVLEETKVNGIPMLVAGDEYGRKTIYKLLSTNPRDYLNPQFNPGTQVN